MMERKLHHDSQCESLTGPPENYQNKDCGPSRESAVTLLARRVKEVESYLDGLKHLHLIAKKLEPNSPAEEVLYDAFCHHHRRL